ncbi:TetR/AcrR family transcriptional regulator [Streptomyces cacaoi]|uniref:TetR/AcrR family transcriptional regulator n=1 Tax=Streptomyces cacaoi TaxID=1898 RepID=UPI0011F16FA1|nr:TetR/AcrR family transcriptional regulator [Streptomyces cacaoi]
MAADGRRLRPRKQPKQARAEVTRQRILRAAAHVFTEYGYAAGTTNRIAEAAGISIGSLYQYYPNKDAILAELTAQHLDAGMAAGARVRSGELPESLDAVLRLFVRIVLGNHVEPPEYLRVLAERSPRTPQVMAMVQEHEDANIAYLREVLETHPEVRVADTATAAVLVTSTLELVVHHVASRTGPAVDRDRFENELVAMMSRYLRGEAEPPGPTA